MSKLNGTIYLEHMLITNLFLKQSLVSGRYCEQINAKMSESLVDTVSKLNFMVVQPGWWYVS